MSSSPEPLETEANSFVDGIEQGGAASTTLPISELRHIQRIFNTFDEDGSGSIDHDELTLVMEAMGHVMSRQQISELVEQVDVAGAGVLTFEQFIQLIQLWKEACKFKLFDQSETSLQWKRIMKSLSCRMLLPDTQWRWWWDLGISIVGFYLWISILYLDTLTAGEGDDLLMYFMAPSILASLLLVADIVVCAYTAYFDKAKDRLVDDPMAVFTRYAKTWLVPDILAALPWELFGSRSSTGIIVVSHFRLLRFVKYPFMFGATDRLNMTPEYVGFHYSFLPIFQILWYVLHFTHMSAVLFVVLDKHLPKTDETGNRTTVLTRTEEPNYTQGLYFILYTLTTCGFGDVVVEGPYLQVFSCVMFIAGTLLNALVIGNVVAMLQQNDIHSERKNKLRETLAVCRYFDIPRPLQEEILQFQNHVLQENLSAAYADLVCNLPDDMQANIMLFVKIRLVSRVPFFKAAHQGAKVALAHQLQSEVYLPEDYIVITNEHGDCMFFIAYGFVDVINKQGFRVATLKQGDFFGEMALLGSSRSRRTASVKSLSYCDTFRLSRTDFHDILSRFPKFKQVIVQVARERRRATSIVVKKLSPVTSPPDPPISRSRQNPLSPVNKKRGPDNGDATEEEEEEEEIAAPADAVEDEVVTVSKLLLACAEECVTLEEVVGHIKPKQTAKKSSFAFPNFDHGQLAAPHQYGLTDAAQQVKDV